MSSLRGGVTTCGQCLAGCGIVVSSDGRVSGDADDPASRGYLCANGRASLALVDHPGRLTKPMVHGREATWEEALRAAASGVRAARDRGGPDAVGLYFGAGDPAGSMAFLAAAGFLQGLGSKRHYNVIGLEATHRYVVAEAIAGNELAVPRPDFERAGGAIILGTNPPVSNDEAGIAAALDAMHKRRAVTVVLDPRRTELARHATEHLQLLPGTDAEVLLAILHVLFRAGKTVPWIGAEADGVERLRSLAATMPPERAAAIAGVDAAAIDRAARLLARMAPVTALTRLGSAMSARGTVNEWLTWAIVAVLGGLGHDGGLVLNEGFLDFETMLGRAPRASGSVLGVLPPADLADAILDAGPGRLRALVVVAADLIASVPNTARLERALRQLDCLVVLDVMPTPTTALATIVLPCAHHLEKHDIALLLPDRMPLRRARMSAPVASPPAGARTEVAIFADLARRLGISLFGATAIDLAVRVASRLGGGGRDRMTPDAAMKVVLPLLSRLSLTWGRVKRGHVGPHGGVPGGEALRRAVKRTGGRFDLAPARFVEELERSLSPAATTDDGALVLSTCNRSRDFINSKLALVGRAAQAAIVHLSPPDADARALREGDGVEVVTAAGTLEARVHVDPALRQGAAGMYFGTPGINRLTSDRDRDPLSRIPAMATLRCSVRPLSPRGDS
jgi:anaerobic selenocysteine-containing dehydrogenase